MSEIEGKATRKERANAGSERVSIKKDELGDSAEKRTLNSESIREHCVQPASAVDGLRRGERSTSNLQIAEEEKLIRARN